MSIQDAATIRPSPPGIRLARPSCDKGTAIIISSDCPAFRLSRTIERCLFAVIASQALYAETLAIIIWTTAPSLRRPSARLAAICLFATLCYVSYTQANTSSLSPIPSSTLVLSRLDPPPGSDTSVIRNTKRTKREFALSGYNSIRVGKIDALHKRFFSTTTSATAVLLVTSETGRSSVTGDNNSDNVNSTTVNLVPLAEHQNDSTFGEDDDTDVHSEGTQRPMPPVHDHGNASYAVGCERRRRGGGGRHGPSARRKSGQRIGGNEGPPSQTARRAHRYSHQPAAEYRDARWRRTPIFQFQTAHKGSRTGIGDPPEMHPAAA